MKYFSKRSKAQWSLELYPELMLYASWANACQPKNRWLSFFVKTARQFQMGTWCYLHSCFSFTANQHKSMTWTNRISRTMISLIIHQHWKKNKQLCNFEFLAPTYTCGPILPFHNIFHRCGQLNLPLFISMCRGQFLDRNSAANLRTDLKEARSSSMNTTVNKEGEHSSEQSHMRR